MSISMQNSAIIILLNIDLLLSAVLTHYWTPSWIICQSIGKSVHTACTRTCIWQGLERIALNSCYFALYVQTVVRINRNSSCAHYMNKLQDRSYMERSLTRYRYRQTNLYIYRDGAKTHLVLETKEFMVRDERVHDWRRKSLALETN